MSAGLRERDFHAVPAIEVGEEAGQRSQCRRAGQGLDPEQESGDDAVIRVHNSSVCANSRFVIYEVLQAIRIFVSGGWEEAGLMKRV